MADNKGGLRLDMVNLAGTSLKVSPPPPPRQKMCKMEHFFLSNECTSWPLCANIFRHLKSKIVSGLILLLILLFVFIVYLLTNWIHIIMCTYDNLC